MTKRPAETAGLAGATGVLLAIVLGVRDLETIAAMVVVVGALPAAVTTVVTNGGIVGSVKRLLFGAR